MPEFLAYLVPAIMILAGAFIVRSGDTGRAQAFGLFVVCLGGIGILAVRATAALAAETAASAGPAIDWTPLIGAVITAAIGAIPVIGALLLQIVRGYLRTRLGIELDAEARSYVQDAAERVADHVAAQASAPTKEGPAPVAAGIVAGGVDMLLAQVPDGLARLGVDRAGVGRMLLTRLTARGVAPAGDGAG